MRSLSVDYSHGGKPTGFDVASMDVRAWLQQWPRVLSQLETLVVGLKRRQVSGPYNCAQFTVELYRNLVGSCKWGTAGQLMDAVREVGRELVAAKPSELAVGNMVRRVLYIIRDEYESALSAGDGSGSGQAATSASLSSPSASRGGGGGGHGKANSRGGSTARGVATGGAGGAAGTGEGGGLGPSLTGMLGGQFGATDFGRSCPDLRQNVVASVSELMTELRDMRGVIKEHAKDTIHANEVILTFGNSATVDAFLKAAAGGAKDGLNFRVIVAEAAPLCSGHVLAKSLAKHGIDTTVISDSAVFAMMARVNKVILSTHAVVANGGLIALNGSHAVALAASDLSVPVVCVTGLFKLCPLFPHDQDTFNCLLSPAAVMSFKDKDSMKNVEVLNPAYDYIPPNLVDLYITNMGGLQPSYIYRLLAEYYHRDDLIISPSDEQAS
ncbi:unnamed protein product [Ectocarpus sp. CCAP 1310/34]|nr:unnamed protein product [Ectocarpus sp. CCAP 1310/34]